MEKYNIFCTETQIKKALELGAPIEDDGSLLSLPTAEQMIGWLEDQEGIISIELRNYSGWCYQVAIYDASYDISRMFKSRKEATLAAIDAALEYLINKK